VLGLEEGDFRVLEDGREQEIAKFELVEDLPITIGITIDTSGSMNEALGEAKRAASDFLERIITPRDRSFAVSFSDQPALLMPRTADVEAVEDALEDLVAAGMTSLYDAVITSLYYFRGVKGRRALVLLSDGEDTSSSIPWRDALEYARRSGVAIYSVGLDIGRLQSSVRGKLRELSQETGGRSFFINRAEELEGVYADIERELRSQYLLAYNSDRPATASEGAEDEFRSIEVKVKGSGLQARTISGYYP
jgi:VWFA-related protein